MGTHFQQKPITIQIKLLLIAVAVIAVFHIETQPFYAENVLQAKNLPVFYQQKQNILNFEKQINQVNYERRVKIFNQGDNDVSNNYNSIISFFFATLRGYDETGNSDRRLNALMLIILMVSTTAFVLVIHRQYTLVKWLLLFFIFAQAVLIPFNCGILGPTYQYLVFP